MTNSDRYGREKYDYGYMTANVKRPELKTYLQWLQKNKWIKVSDYVEGLLDADMKKNKDYKAGK